ncbi:hypothetical protein FHT82_006031 [Rhizobium sp. BK275]|uniref:hypothetical protein n=1 Tax=unclassified Rhizobium TaxID=2613769 RepID=UPI00160EA890|nr:MULTISPECIES: hypothetical protein [unclassified Rhizobium]MBB3393238.1 hypothetical protein [Rhizobium sp. BK275]MBB3409742.1 hypothetical protein [Rhizobium sp. BK316]
MKTAAITGTIACIAFAAAAVAQSNLDASPVQPDYVAVTQALDKNGKPVDPTVTITHHDGMFLSETLRDGTKSIGFGPASNDPVLRWSRQADGQITFLELLLRDRKPDAAKTETPQPLAEVSTVAGERCRWRETASKSPSPGTFIAREQTCVTDDGIVIETRLLAPNDVPIYHTRLTSLDRRAIAPAEIDPPSEILTAEFWLRPIRSHNADPSQPDFDITLETVSGSTIRLLRHYPWHYREQRDGGGSVSIKIWNRLEAQGISYRQAGGHRRLTAARPTDDGSASFKFDETTGKISLGKAEAVLGESCEWFDLMPGVQDAGNRECLTRDGLPLKLDISGMNLALPYTATSFRRRAVALSEMRLPAEAFSLDEWGLPAVR